MTIINETREGINVPPLEQLSTDFRIQDAEEGVLLECLSHEAKTFSIRVFYSGFGDPIFSDAGIDLAIRQIDLAGLTLEDTRTEVPEE
jgi:hypothetical protein